MRILSEQVVLFLSHFILMTCSVLVLWQGWQSTKKYLDKPQTTAFSIEPLHDLDVMPELTVCPKRLEYLKRNESKETLEKCGL